MIKSKFVNFDYNLFQFYLNHAFNSKMIVVLKVLRQLDVDVG